MTLTACFLIIGEGLAPVCPGIGFQTRLFFFVAPAIPHHSNTVNHARCARVDAGFLRHEAPGVGSDRNEEKERRKEVS